MTAYPGFSREALELIHLYESYGWTFTVSSKGHAIGRPEPQPREPLTDAQVLERIRRLVGAEDHTEELDTLTRDLEAAEEQVIALTRQLAEVQSRADGLQADLDAWLSLAPRAQS